MRQFSFRRLATFSVAVGSFVGSVVTLPQPLRAADGPVAVDKLPAAVRSAADKAIANVHWSEASKETEDGKTTYEIDGDDADDHDVTVRVMADGKVVSIEQEISTPQFPEKAISVLKARFPNFHVSAAYSIRRGDDLMRGEPTELHFGLDGTDGDTHEVSAEVTGDGMLLSLEREIARSEVPELIMTAIRGKMPMFHLTSAHEVYERDKLVGYVLEGKRGAKANVETAVFVSADGKEIETGG